MLVCQKLCLNHKKDNENFDYLKKGHVKKKQIARDMITLEGLQMKITNEVDGGFHAYILACVK